MSVRENVLYGDTGRENVSDSFVTGGDVTLYLFDNKLVL